MIYYTLLFAAGGGGHTQFQRLNATFGALERRSISFAPGFNIVQAPNESGKSTLAAFLRAMLYGLSTRDRGALADKNRFSPWSGSPMQGMLELSTEAYGDITIQRSTARANSPMGRFSATYTGTGNEVAELTGTNCGELLTGIPREVYERSAFIRQSGLAIDANAELERRIAALITTGDEGVSFSEASAALKKQLNARRSNSRNGQIPALEQEIHAKESALSELRALQSQRAEAEEALTALREEESILHRSLAAHDIADKQSQYIARETAKRDADDAAREARMFRRILEDSHVPPREVLEESRSRLRAAEDLAARQKDTETSRQKAESALNEVVQRYRKPYKLLAVCSMLFALIFLAAPIVCALLSFDFAAYLWFLLLPAAVFAGYSYHSFNTARTASQLRADREAALREEDAACAAIRSQLDKMMALVYAVIPAVDMVSANAYVYENLARYDTLARMESEARNKKQYYEDYPVPDLKGVPAKPVERPSRSREAIQYELEHTMARRAEAQSRADYTAGQIQAIGDAGELEAALTQKHARLADLVSEYDAIALAMEALEHANTALQNRFSPELGKRAAEYFSALTGGKYDSVALDRAFHALASEAGDNVGRDAALLSQGAGDQLYLAVRLAICDMVLPEEKHIPLVLDDALTSFDDTRCQAALELLAKASETRQIILLTCQRREAAYITGHKNVKIQSL